MCAPEVPVLLQPGDESPFGAEQNFGPKGYTNARTRRIGLYFEAFEAKFTGRRGIDGAAPQSKRRTQPDQRWFCHAA